MITDRVHAVGRGAFELPQKPPRNSEGTSCGVCSNDCRIGRGEKGFCGLVSNRDGRLVRMGGTSERGIVQWYYDPLPTNCVAWWFCPGCTGAGYPKYSYRRGAERGYVNLAVFYGACSFDCLYCQNWQHRNLAAKLGPVINAESLADKADTHVSSVSHDKEKSTSGKAGGSRVSCICYFGGDPSPQMPHALKTSQIAVEEAEREGRIMRICWETNGYWKDELALKAAELSLKSGGVIKFDLKTWDVNMNKALCGVSNKPTLSSFNMIGDRYFKRRTDLPILTASTLLVPGYVDAEEVENLAKFIMEIDPRIPYTLLAFHPQYVMNDLPTTSREQAYQCYDVANKYLERVRIGNIHLLS